MNDQDSSEAQGSASGEQLGLLKTSEVESLSDRELSALVALRVMGWQHGRLNTYCEPPFISCSVCLTNFATDISAAMEVVEKMRADGWGVEINDDCTALWTVTFYKQPVMKVTAQADGEWQTLPRAICLAALQATVTGLPDASLEPDAATVPSPPLPKSS